MSIYSTSSCRWIPQTQWLRRLKWALKVWPERPLEQSVSTGTSLFLVMQKVSAPAVRNTTQILVWNTCVTYEDGRWILCSNPSQWMKPCWLDAFHARRWQYRSGFWVRLLQQPWMWRWTSSARCLLIMNCLRPHWWCKGHSMKTLEDVMDMCDWQNTKPLQLNQHRLQLELWSSLVFLGRLKSTKHSHCSDTNRNIS